MAPRSRARAAQAAPSTAAPPTIADLPDAVLLRCLGFLTLQERCAQGLDAGEPCRKSICMAAGGAISGQSFPAAAAAHCRRHCRRHPTCGRRQRAALVSRRFAALCCSPELLQEVEKPLLHSLPALHSFLAWLVRHGQHIQRLRLPAYCAQGEDENSWAAAVASCLAVVGAAGQLTELDASSGLLHTEWLPAMRSLRHLRLSGNLLRISLAIAGLTALQSLELDSEEIIFAAGARLPSSITRLVVAGDEAEQMPDQVSSTRATLLLVVGLTNWRHLCLFGPDMHTAAAALLLAVCPAAAAAAPAAGGLRLLD